LLFVVGSRGLCFHRSVARVASRHIEKSTRKSPFPGFPNVFVRGQRASNVISLRALHEEHVCIMCAITEADGARVESLSASTSRNRRADFHRYSRRDEVGNER